MEAVALQIVKLHALVEVGAAAGQDVPARRRCLARHQRLDRRVEDRRPQPVQLQVERFPQGQANRSAVPGRLAGGAA